MIFDDSGDRLGWGTFDTEVQALNSIHLISLIYEYPLPDVSISNKERNIVILAKPYYHDWCLRVHRIPSVRLVLRMFWLIGFDWLGYRDIAEYPPIYLNYYVDNSNWSIH